MTQQTDPSLHKEQQQMFHVPRSVVQASCLSYRSPPGRLAVPKDYRSAPHGGQSRSPGHILPDSDTESAVLRKRKLAGDIPIDHGQTAADRPFMEAKCAASWVPATTDTQSRKPVCDVNGNTYCSPDHWVTMDSGHDSQRMDPDKMTSFPGLVGHQMDSGIGSLASVGSALEQGSGLAMVSKACEQALPDSGSFYLTDSLLEDEGRGGCKRAQPSDDLAHLDDNQPRIHSLPPPGQSSYAIINQNKLPPKKRRLYYEQDLLPDPAPAASHQEILSGLQQSSLPSNFTPPDLFLVQPPVPSLEHIPPAAAGTWMVPSIPVNCGHSRGIKLQYCHPAVPASVVHELSKGIGALKTRQVDEANDRNGTSSVWEYVYGKQSPAPEPPCRQPLVAGDRYPAPEPLYRQPHVPGDQPLASEAPYRKPHVPGDRPRAPDPPYRQSHVPGERPPAPELPYRRPHVPGERPPAPEPPYQQPHMRGSRSPAPEPPYRQPHLPGERPPAPEPPYRQPHVPGDRSPAPEPPYRQPHAPGDRSPAPKPPYRQPHVPGDRSLAPEPPYRQPHVPGDRPPAPTPSWPDLSHLESGPMDLTTSGKNEPRRRRMVAPTHFREAEEGTLEPHLSRDTEPPGQIPPSDTNKQCLNSDVVKSYIDDHHTQASAHSEQTGRALTPGSNPNPAVERVATSALTPDSNSSPAVERVATSALTPDSNPSPADERVATSALTPGSNPSPAVERVATQADEDGDLPLHIAVVQNELRAVEVLVDVMGSTGVSIDYQNHLKQTALHLAVITRVEPIVSCLLRAGAAPTIPDRKGQTSFHLAVGNKSVQCLQSLITYSKTKADINLKNYEGLTPLHRAVQSGHVQCIETLLDHGADINMVDGKSGKSPLYLAFECNQPLVADLLLVRGADVNIPTYSGSTVLQAANTRGQHLLSHLISRGVDGSTPNTRDFQMKLAAKVNRNRNKQLATLNQKNNLNAQAGNLNSKVLMPVCRSSIGLAPLISKNDTSHSTAHSTRPPGHTTLQPIDSTRPPGHTALQPIDNRRCPDLLVENSESLPNSRPTAMET